MSKAYVSDEYARAYEAGALAALDYMADEWPHLAEGHDDATAPTMVAAEHIGRVIDLMLGRGEVSPSGEERG